MSRSPRQEFLTQSSMSITKKQSSTDSSDSNPWDSLGSPTFLWSPSSGIPLQDGLYMDSRFPVQNMPIQTDVVWKRPKEICPFPQFIVDGATRMDVCQGVLSDCWFLSAVASLSLYPSLMDRVVPSGQGFQKGYNGCFYFQFWQYGEWNRVRVDDRLPTRNGQLIYLHSSNREEFWSALLEKAYAKMKGGYNALNMGFPHEAMVDMTGGITEVFMCASLPRALGTFLRSLLEKGALINCANSQGPLEKSNEFGILFRHAYSVTGLETIKSTIGPVELVRIRNPWGKAEWEGAWSDKRGIEWNMVSAEEQKRVQRIQNEDGEFWMSLADFRQNFEIMEVCHLSEETLSEGGVKKPWKCTPHHGQWTPRQEPPQFNLTLLEEDDDPSDPELTCSFLLALMQKHTRQRGTLFPVGLHIYKARSERDFLSSRDVSQLSPVLSTVRDHGYVPRRELVVRGRLAPGHYIIIPCAEETNQAGEFLLRVLTEKGNAIKAAVRPGIDKTSPTPPLSPRLAGLPSIDESKVLFVKHCVQGSFCRPLDLHNLLTEAIAKGVFAGSEKKLSLEQCKSFVVLMDSQGMGRLDLAEFQALWEKLRKWTGIFMTFDKNKNQSLDYQEISPALSAAGIQVDEFILQLIGLRYTEPDMTVSFPGFLFLLMKLDCMMRKFQSFDMTGMGMISVNCRQFLHMTMYN
ncbi:calpain-9 isoform X2 [Pimephales promelas]|uniref:calpain-9 isoform X2 n=1 Tax=Pimephales promelas TaxID=90988 RepID=UPI0019556A8E|nr:calpain-9 isoform X2 [Pimephales promelas]KAG1932672.1 calpain-1 catalytic subunit [Pimephales promelas]